MLMPWFNKLSPETKLVVALKLLEIPGFHFAIKDEVEAAKSSIAVLDYEDHNFNTQYSNLRFKIEFFTLILSLFDLDPTLDPNTQPKEKENLNG